MTPVKQASTNRGLVLFFVGVALLIVTGLLLTAYVHQPRPGASMSRPPEVNAIAGWMTLAYISRAYNVPEPLLLDALNMSDEDARGQSLDQIARRRHQTTQETILKVRSTVEQYRGQAASRVAPSAATTRVTSGAVTG